MIDVVFLLLVFFLAVMRPVDVLAHLDVSREQPGGGESISVLRIDVLPHGYTMNGRRVNTQTMDRMLGKLGKISQTQSVIITSDSNASHERLVTVLDVCAKAGLKNLSLMSR